MTRNVILEAFKCDVQDNLGDLKGIETEWLHLLDDPDYISNHSPEDLIHARKVLTRLSELTRKV